MLAPQEILQAELASVLKRYNNLKELGEGALRQARPEEYTVQPAAECNSLALQIKHLHGNMLSRWTEFLTTDGEKEWRERDGEFEDDPSLSAADWLALWDEGWACLFATLNGLQPEDLGKTITIRGQAMTAIDAINRQLTHYGYHIGQMVLQVKMLRGADWQTLSVARGKSKAYTPRPND